jgi:hypothetical protein
VGRLGEKFAPGAEPAVRATERDPTTHRPSSPHGCCHIRVHRGAAGGGSITTGPRLRSGQTTQTRRPFSDCRCLWLTGGRLPVTLRWLWMGLVMMAGRSTIWFLRALVILCGVWVLPSAFAEDSASTRVDLFVIERNKNRNLVQYVVRLDRDCRPVGEAPVEVYWRMLEIGPEATEDIGVFEQMAYGIKSQVRRGSEFDLRLEALPEKALRVRTSKGAAGECVAGAYGSIKGSEGRLRRIFVQADEGALMPSVRHIDISGVTAAGAPLSERLAPD